MTEVLLPNVHRVLQKAPDTNWGESCLIVMNFTQGSTMHGCWGTINEEMRANIVGQVAKYIASPAARPHWWP